MTFQDFIELVPLVLGERVRPNPQQRACIENDPSIPLLIVAGPGTGKTTVLALRALRHVFVDRFLPEQIVITTFTKKAAREIRTRLLDWGTPLIDAALARYAGDAEFVAHLLSVDINRFITGTLDSICEDALESAREPNERPPVIAETFASNLILSRQGGIFEEINAVGQELSNYLFAYAHTEYPPRTVGDVTTVVREIIDRLRHDEVNREQYLREGEYLAARQAVIRIYDRYIAYLRETNRMDFPALESAILDRVRSDRVPELLHGVRAILVDEYQDTNLLQEQIYFRLARSTGSSLSVVGDDDQSLYRFRGATIELFRDFLVRVHAELQGEQPRLLFLSKNYRSTPDIISFFNRFVENDPDFQAARVQPPKPPIAETRTSNNVRVLGMFRDSSQVLASDLADFLQQVFRGGGRPADQLIPEAIHCNHLEGNLGDAVVIGDTVKEFGLSFQGQPPTPRFWHHLRLELAQRQMACFNPRGRALKDIPSVAETLGLVLECLDPAVAAYPDGRVITDLRITQEAKRVFRGWRNAATAFTNANANEHNQRGQSLTQIVRKWQRLTQLGESVARDWPVLDIFYDLMPWFEPFQDDPEHQVYLEAISRCAAEAATVSAYRGLLLRDEPHRVRSVQAAIRDILAPIAEDLVDPDEEIMASVPRDRLNMMTIHQSKGLEFPLVIVDVSSRFRTNNQKQRFARFPESPSSVTLLEDDLAHCTPIGPLRLARTALQRSFDDLRRLFFVAYSRPQSILMLVGCTPGLRYNSTIKNVATFWRVDGTWGWRAEPLQRPHPPLADEIPLTLI